MVVDFSWVVLLESTGGFPAFQYLRKKLSTAEVGNDNNTHPLFLRLCKSERGKKWITLQEDDDSIANAVDCGLWWNVNIELTVVFATWQICLVKATVRPPSAQAVIGIRARAFR